MTIITAALTDTGRIRARNEDSFLIDPAASLYAVADGMGGHAAGDVASQTAVAAFSDAFAETRSPLIAMKSANRAVIERAQAESEKAGMGTTMTAVHILGKEMLVAHVGDSRLYRLRQDALAQLTRDHTVAQDMIDSGALGKDAAMQHPANSMLTRALGTRADVVVDLLEEDLLTGDLLLLCSDGLTSMVTDDDLHSILRQEKPLERLAADLIEAANLRGGHDNITALLLRIG
jgi:protein phosphatase